MPSLVGSEMCIRDRPFPAAARDEHQQPVAGQERHEAAKHVVHVVEAAVVGMMVELHVGDDGHLGTQEQEAAVALVGLRHQPLALPLSLIHISEPTRLGMISYAV